MAFQAIFRWRLVRARGLKLNRIADSGQGEGAPEGRWACVDAFRGLAIAGMVVVNNPGSWDHVYPPLLHAPWHGCTFTDLVFPWFLFVAGTSMAFSLDGARGRGIPRKSLMARAARRAFVLFLLGLLLNGSSLFLDWMLNGAVFDAGNLRIMGVLQRIGGAYALAAAMAIYLPRGGQWLTGGLLLVAHWAAMTLIPVPGFGAGDLSPQGNAAAWVDRLLLSPSHLYLGGPYDPEGLLGTFPAAVTVLAGYWAGEFMGGQPVRSRTSLEMLLAGANGIMAGTFWGMAFPVNKALWTGSYVVLTAGWSLVLLAVLYEIMEARGWKRWARPLEIAGLNAIFLFVASGLVGRVLYRVRMSSLPEAPSLYRWLFETFFLPWGEPVDASLAFALTTLLLWWLMLYALYRRRVFFKV